MAVKRKPAEIEVGKAYRLNLPFGAGPSENIVVVTEIDFYTKTCRNVRYVALPPYRDGLDGYSNFLRRVHSEMPTAKH